MPNLYKRVTLFLNCYLVDKKSYCLGLSKAQLRNFLLFQQRNFISRPDCS